MKQLLTAGVLALGIHGFLLGINFKWPGRVSLDRPAHRALNITLTSIPVKKAPEPSVKKPKPALEKPTVFKKKKKKPKQKRILKMPPEKTIQIPDQSRKIDVSKTIPEKTAEKTESRFDSEQTLPNAPLKADKETSATLSPVQMIQEARPIYRLNPSPKYPRIARIRGYQGNVLLDVLVSKEGKVNDLKIFRSSGHPILDRAAASSVKNWLFEPGRVGEEKAVMWVRVPIRFELK